MKRKFKSLDLLKQSFRLLFDFISCFARSKAIKTSVDDEMVSSCDILFIYNKCNANHIIYIYI